MARARDRNELRLAYRAASRVAGAFLFGCWILLAAGKVSAAQDPQPAQEERYEIRAKFRDAHLFAVLEAISKTTGLVFVPRSGSDAKIDFVSDAPLTKVEIIDLVNRVLRPQGLYLRRFNEKIYEVLTLEEAKRKEVPIIVGSDPDLLQPSDRIVTVIAPLQNLDAKTFGTDLAKTLPKDTEVIRDAGNNSLVMTGPAEAIRDFLVLLKKLDESRFDPLKTRVIQIKNADVAEVANTVQSLFRIPPSGVRGPQAGSGQLSWAELMSGQARPRVIDVDKVLAGQQPTAMFVSVVPDPRSNSIVVIATEENLKVIESVVAMLDQGRGSAAQVRFFPLKHGVASDVEQVLKQSLSLDARSSGGATGKKPEQPWPASESYPVTIVSDVANNTLIVTATGVQMGVIEGMIGRMDISDPNALGIKIIYLRHAEAKKIAPALFQALAESAPGRTPYGRAAPGTQLARIERPLRVVAAEHGNSLILAATSEDMRRLEVMIEALDQPTGRAVATRTFALLRRVPSQVAGFVQGFLRQLERAERGGSPVEGEQKNAAEPSFGVSHDDKSGLLVVTAPADHLGQLEKLIESLDAEKQPVLRKTEAIELRHANAEYVEGLLKSIYLGTDPPEVGWNLPIPRRLMEDRGRPTGSGEISPPPQQPRPGIAEPQSQKAEHQPMRGSEPPAHGIGPEQEGQPPQPHPLGQQDPDKPEFRSDPEGNRIIVRGPPHLVEEIKRLIEEQLDRHRAQVLIRAMVVEVTLDDEMQFGVEGFWQNKLRLPGGDPATHGIETGFGIDPLAPGLRYFLNSAELEASLNAFARKGNLKVLATPRILTLNNQPARIMIGGQVPVLVTSQQTPQGGIVNSITYRNVGIQLNVIPHVSSDRTVTMLVQPEVSEVGGFSQTAPLGGGEQARSFNVTLADTTVAVRAGQTVVLGGLIREMEEATKSGIPILADLPLIGALFSRTSRFKQRRELMIFLTPHVVNSQREMDELTTLEKSRLKLISERDLDFETKTWLQHLFDAPLRPGGERR